MSPTVSPGLAFRSHNPGYPVMVPQEVLSDAMLGHITYQAYALYSFLRVMQDTTFVIKPPELDDGSPGGPVRHDPDLLAERFGISLSDLKTLLESLERIGWVSFDGPVGLIANVVRER